MSSVSDHSIFIESRHDKANELAELNSFVDAAIEAELDMFVATAFYDSNSCCCSFTFRMGLRENEEAAQELLSLAKETISQFEWFGTIYHGNGFGDSDDSGADEGEPYQNFEDRLEQLHRSMSTSVTEIDAAVVTYARLLTAKSMCVSVFGDSASPAVVASIFTVLTAEARLQTDGAVVVSEEGNLA